jgi:hypothetical protein
MKYTPRQVAAFLALASERRSDEAADALVLVTLGARGDPKHVDATIRKLRKE